jgi:hypothetical protein
MGMVIVSLEPSEPRMLLVGIRDEILDRPRLPPGRHWPLPAASPSAEPGQAWAAWHTLTGGGGPAETNPAAIRVRREQRGGRIYGTTSASYVAFGPAGMRYDFEPAPGQIAV